MNHAFEFMIVKYILIRYGQIKQKKKNEIKNKLTILT